MTDIKFASGLHVFGSTADRYVLSGYKKEVPLKDMIKTAATVPDLQAVELVETWHINKDNADEVLADLEKAGLKLSMLIPDLWASGKWGMGSFAAKEEKVRRDAVETTKRAMDMAAQVGCNIVDVWLGQDGYDYPFQVDYIKAWDRMVEGLRECADHNPKVILGMEYKIKEPRTHCFIGSIGKQIVLFDAIKRDNLGIVLDVGHSLEGYESMAESAALSKYFGDRLTYLHLNDNWRLWDDDMMVGSIHTIELLELLFWLEKIGYSGWYSLDIFPYRDDSVGVATESIQWIKDLRRVVGHIGMDKVEKVIAAGDQAKASKMIREGIFSLPK
jgi:sugar phosphate isomerase/epimerase